MANKACNAYSCKDLGGYGACGKNLGCGDQMFDVSKHCPVTCGTGMSLKLVDENRFKFFITRLLHRSLSPRDRRKLAFLCNPDWHYSTGLSTTQS